GNLSAAFELRRLARTGGIAATLIVAVVALSQLGFLFPQASHDRTIPPQKPVVPPPAPDHVIFTYKLSRPVPLRLGVLDVYDTSTGAWLLPPYDSARIKALHPPASIPHLRPPGKTAITATIRV